ncbi:hypothetical protein SLS53_008645 [Cytospora paraplurivora]|uniref:Uncharacterized protein n=1 Tax=Cytospora paraplurivora TaxID=2898453 RepID=A0AAN9YCL3_9PEZI
MISWPRDRSLRNKQALSSTSEERPYPCLFFRSVPSETTWSMGRTRSTRFCVVDTQDEVAELIQTIVSVDDAVLFLFLHGSLLAVHLQSSNRVHIVDLELIGQEALEARQKFSPAHAAAAAAEGLHHPEYPMWNDVCRLPSLRAIFESPTIPKVFFDCRGAMSTLRQRYKIELRATEEKKIKDESVGLRDFLMEEGKDGFGWEKQVTVRPLPMEVALYYVNQVSAGSRDSPLTNHGVLQARRLGAHLASRSSTIGPVHHIFSSNLQRAVKTAEAITEAQAGVAGLGDVPVVVQLAELRERDFGSDEGKRYGTRAQPAEIAARPVDWIEPESRVAMKMRVDRFIQAYLIPAVLRGFESGANHSVVVVAHGIILNVLLRSLLSQFGPEEITRLSRPSDPPGRSESLATWSNTGYVEANLRLVKRPATMAPVGLNSSAPLPSQPTPPSAVQPALAAVGHGGGDASAFAIRMTVQTVNSNHHLAGLKKTRGGIGSAAFDQKQKTLDSMFSRPAQKPKLNIDGNGGSSSTRG